MDEAVIAILVLLVIGGGLFAIPIVALVVAVKANRRAGEALAGVRTLRRDIAAPRPPVPEPAAEPLPPPEPVPEPPPRPEPPPPRRAPRVVRPPPAPAPAPARSLEEKIGLIWFTRIGALVGIVAAGWFFKYMVDNDWVGPWGRVTIGGLAGLALLGWGELLARGKKKTHPVFVQGVLGLGLALLLIASYASFAFYDLLPLPVTFGIVALLCLFGGALAVHHRSEAILVLSLLAAFLNPVMLSTGVDRPLVLFSYLLVMTGAALAVGVKLGFRVATWAAVAGAAILFLGWYVRFFDPSQPPPSGRFDQPPEALQGAYYPLAARWVPLLFALLFPAAWSGAGLGLRRRGQQRTPLVLYLVAAVAAHAAFAALLPDRPELLGGVLCALGAGCAVLFVREGRSEWLGLPMVASFLVLAAVSAGLEREAPLAMMLATGGLSAIYFAVFLRTSHVAGRLASGLALLLLGGAGLGFVVLGALWLMPQHFVLFGLLLTALSVVYLAVALTIGSAITITVAFLVSLIGLGLTSTSVTETWVGFLIVAAVWFLLYVGFVCVDLFVRRAPSTPARLAVLAGAGIGFTMLWLRVTPASADLLRALLSAATGAVYLGIGLRMRREGPAAENRALLPLGLALVFFTLAVPFLLTGPSITVTWAIEGAVLAYLAVRARAAGEEGQPAWLVGSLLVFFVSAIRFLAEDLPWLGEQHALFLRTGGAEGTLLATPFLHPRAWALLALGVSLLAAARFLGRIRARESFRRFSLGFLILGHVAVLLLLIGEARLLFTASPFAFPRDLPQEEFTVKLREWRGAIVAQRARLDMVTTVVLGAYAAALVALGFAFKHLVHRVIGIALFGIALLKLGLWDIWALETLHKIAVGASIAALLLCSGFLYARFGDRIRNLLVERGPPALWLVGCLLLFAANAQAAEPERYARERPIEGVTAAGDYRLDVDVALYGASRSGLADLRIAGPEGGEVPLVLRRVWEPRKTRRHRGRVLDPVTLPDGGSRALLDFGPNAPEHTRVMLEIEPVNYLRRTRVESSGNGKVFGLLAEGGYVFDIATGGPRAVRNWIRYPATRARYLRITLRPGDDRQALRIRAAALPPLERRPARPTERRLALALDGPAATEKGRTVYRLARLPDRVPLGHLDLEVETAEFVRRVTLEASTRKLAWFRVGGGVVYRVPQEAGRPPDESLTVHVAAGERPFLRLVIADGDNPPLAVQAVTGRYPAEEIVFRATSAGPHTLYVGREGDRPPRYDLADLLQRGGAAPPRTATLGALRANPLFSADREPDAPQPWTERHRTLLHLLIGAVVLALALWTLRLLRSGGARE
ncbi:MAG: DUF2339 domain-containing protein [Planctomycetota bacterium]|jgi:uncharacterized membrane protein